MANIEEIIDQIESDDNTNEEDILHKLLELAVAVTGLGEIENSYTKTIIFPISNTTITSDPYYRRLWLGDEDREIEDKKTINALTQEIKERLLEFDSKIRKPRTEFAQEIFKRPIDNIINMIER